MYNHARVIGELLFKYPRSSFSFCCDVQLSCTVLSTLNTFRHVFMGLHLFHSGNRFCNRRRIGRFFIFIPACCRDDFGIL